MKAIYPMETIAEQALETAISALMAAPYNSIKDGGTFWRSPGVVTRKDAERVLVRRLIAKDRRGAPNPF